MANIAQDTITNAWSITRSPVVGNAVGTSSVMGPVSTSSGPSIPTSGLVWWSKK